MSVNELFRQLCQHHIVLNLSSSGQDLVIKGQYKAPDHLVDQIKQNKNILIDLLRSGKFEWDVTGISVPPNFIPNDADIITPEMLTLVELTAREIQVIASAVKGGMANIQDIYPLTSFQEQLFFLSLMTTAADPYVHPPLVLHFRTRHEADSYVDALQAVIDRHDALRTGICWEGLAEPVQVVWRRAPLIVDEISLDPDNGDIARQLQQRLDRGRHRLDVRQAPMMRIIFSQGVAKDAWIVAVVIHHLVIDYHSMGTIHREVEAHLLGDARQLLKPVQFRNFVAQGKFGVSRKDQKTFFHKMLADVDEPTAPFGMNAMQSIGSGVPDAQTRAFQRVDSDLARRLREQTRILSVSTASLFHLAWALVLARFTGRADVVFGTTLSGRGAGIGQAVGLFTNDLPLRVKIGDDSVRDGVHRTHALLAQLLQHEHASLALAQRCSGVAAPTPLFSTAINFRYGLAPESGAREDGNNPTISGFDEIGPPVHSRSMAEDMGKQGNSSDINAEPRSDVGLLGGKVLQADEGQLAYNPQMLSAEERHKLLVEWNRTETDYPKDNCIHELFEAQVKRAPDAAAVVYEQKQLSYGELNERANHLAHHLIGLAVGPDVRVATCMGRSIELVIAQIAILKCGGVYVPLDQGAPVERQAFILEDCQAQIVLATKDSTLSENLSAVRINLDELALSDQAQHNPALQLDSTAPVYIMYTSGSTGQPKGVVIPHRAVARLVINNGYAQFGADDRVAFASNPAFDASTMEVWAPLLNGGCLVVMDQATVLFPERFKHGLRQHAVSVLWMSVGLFNQYADLLSDVFPQLRYLIVGGDALDPKVIARVLRNGPPQHLINGYGPTETTTFAATYEITEVPDGAKSIPIGRPIANTQIYLLDAHGRPAPIGVAGEIYIGGAGVARGYLNQPELTSEKFMRDSFAGKAGARMYRTGDLGRHLSNGNIEFLGRNDHQVKLRGFRIELGEIEARLGEHKAVREAVVLAREDSPGDKRLVAYYCAKENQEVGAGQLREYLGARLPEYMAPAAYVELDAMPLTPNGKLDRKALPAPEGDAYAHKEYEAPRGEVEVALTQLWADVLKVERVGRFDNFFELGGHSLLIVRLNSQIRQILGLEVKPDELFAHPQLLDFARIVQAAQNSTQLPIELAQRDEPLPLSFAQQWLWFVAQMEGASQAYHIPLGLRLQGKLNTQALKRTLDTVVARHEALRTTFPQEGEQPVQRIAAADIGFRLQEHDLGASADAESELQALAEEEAAQAFDLQTGPLIRGRLIRLDEHEHVLLVTMHHIVSDGWSMGVLGNELSVLYGAFSQGRDDPLPTLAVQYADYAVWQRRFLTGEVLRGQSEYWRQTLSGVPVLLSLPTDKPRPAQQSYAGASVTVQLSSELSTGLKALSQRHGVTLFMTLLASWAILLGRLASEEDVVIGIPVANRSRTEFEGLIGFFINTLALRLRVSGNLSVAQLLQAVRQRALEAQQHQDLPFEQVVQLVNPQRGLAHTPLFQVMFAWQNYEDFELTLPGLSLQREEETAHNIAQFDLSLDLSETQGCIVGDLKYATALFEQATVERYVDHLQRLLRQMVADDQQDIAHMQLPDRRQEQQHIYDAQLTLNIENDAEGFLLNAEVAHPSVYLERSCGFMHKALEQLVDALERNPQTPLRSLDVMPATERQKLLVEWNDTAADYPKDKCIHELFEEQAARIPEAIAAVYEDSQLRYGELNERANRLAWHLKTLGVGPDVPVAICVERSLQMIVGLLGILKAGGAYVPLDPTYPAERLAYMLADSAPQVVLTHGAVRQVLGELQAPVIDLDKDEAEWCRQSNDNPTRAQTGLQPGHLAYVMYTSGSTGKPKGVMVEHGGICNQITVLQKRYGLSAEDRVLQFSSIAFDMSVEELFGALLSGCTLVLRTDRWLSDSQNFAALCQSENISVANLPVAFWQYLELSSISYPVCLRQIMVGGEAVGEHALRVWFERPGYRPKLFNAYGPTEATVNATIQEVSADRGTWKCIGHPIANTRIYLLDAHGRPVPIGVAGEIYIGGAGVARGYLNQPELTKEKFMRDSFADKARARMYRTGDLGRHLPNGNIEFLGRNDHQVKIRGFRIELGEIEARLGEHKAVREAVVLAREDSPGDKRLVAYYCVKVNQEVDAGQLRGYLEGRLPEYMAPAAYVELEAMPLTPNGKLDRRALLAPDGEAYVRKEYEAPQGEVEVTLARLWADVLKVERVGRFDNFFELGGHSLLIVRLIWQIRQILGLEVKPEEVFAHSQLLDFARIVQAAQDSVLLPIELAQRDGPLALSFAQQWLWFLAQMEGGSQAYHIPLGLRLQGKLNKQALKRALDTMVARHEALRTSFPQEGGQPMQRIAAADIGFRLQEHDLGASADAESELRALAEEEAVQAFDLQTGPLIRGRLIRLGEHEHVLLVTMHHIVFDGWSFGVLSNELSVLYGAFSRGRADPLPALAIQYADYVAWQHRELTGEVLQAQTAYWQRTLADVPTLLSLPTDRPRPAQQDYIGGAVGIEINERLTGQIKALSRKYGATLFMTLLAAWAIVLSRLAGQQDVVIGTAVANRSRAELEGMIGVFINTLAQRLEISGELSVAQLLQAIRERVIEAQQHQDLPLEQVVQIVNPPRSLAHTPLFQVMLDWRNNGGGSDLELPGLQLQWMAPAWHMAKFDLTLTLSEVQGCIVGGLEYAVALFDEATAKRYGDYLYNVLQAMVADESQLVCSLQILPADERHRLLVEWNQTEADYPKGKCIHELFEAQVKRNPDGVAVVYENSQLSYREINEQSNRLARYLRKLGVVPDARVAICVERGLDMIVGLLAILKAGGAYVPLDPAYPVERLVYMVKDSAPVVVLTHAQVSVQLQAELRVALAESLGAAPLIDIEGDTGRWERQPGSDLGRDSLGLTPRHLAYVIYTSGSTGQPKGVMVEHDAVLNLLNEWLIRLRDFPGNAMINTALWTSIAFDVSVFEIFVSLLSAASLHIVPEISRGDPELLISWFKEKVIQFAYLPPFFIRRLAGLNEEKLSELSFKLLLVGVEPLVEADLFHIQKSVANLQIINGYGPTETTIFCSTYYMIRNRSKSVPIGRPIANTRIYLLDAHGQPVPIGAVGEIHIGGAGVARGYLNRPALTEEKFVADPFAGKIGARMYRTGDLGRYFPDGNIEFLGRNDHQVKIRGFRIELGEIEARLGEHEAMREAIVIAWEDSPGDKRLVAYYCAKENQEVGAEQLREHLSTVLPEYMVPAAYVQLQTMPLTPNGKLDRKLLPTPDGEAYAQKDYEAPQGEVEIALAQIWSDMLKVDRVGRNDDFFDLGGHSLVVMRVTSLLNSKFFVSISVSEFFENSQLASLAEVVIVAQLAQLDLNDLNELS